MSQYKDDRQIEPTQPVYNSPYSDNPYELTEATNEYGIPLIAPPPPEPQKKRHTLRWTIIIVMVVLIIAASSFVAYLFGHTYERQSTVTPQLKYTQTAVTADVTAKASAAVSSTTPTVTISITPTVQTIPSSTLTADELYQHFENAYLPVASPTEIDGSWWLSMGENFYPAKGGVQFTDTNSNSLLQIAIFNTTQAAATDIQQATSSPNGWAAQYIQVNTCVLFSAEGPINIQYYKATMQTYCI